jgi:hypothetical protein
MNSRIIALLTDFGHRDAYAGIMKGVILSRDPEIRLVDLTHEVEPQDLTSAAYILYTAWNSFPAGSTFCAVVDPGVGSDRGALLAEIRDRYLVAPDNGLISVVLRMMPSGSVYALEVDGIIEAWTDADSATEASRAGRAHPSATFHGRDVFAPAAALCALGGAERIRGRRLQPVLLPEVFPEHGDRAVSGRILHIDRFGNCITSLHRNDLEIVTAEKGPITVQAGAFRDDQIRRTYSDVSVDAPLCLIGSSDSLEIAVREGSAAARFQLSRGQSVTVAAGDS